MAVTTTFKTLIENVLEETGLGYVLGTVTGTTTGWSASTSYLKGPFPAQRLPRGSAMLLTDPVAAGTSSATSSTTMTDSTATWQVNSLVGASVALAGGITGTVVSNTATVVTVAAWSPAGDPADALAYTITAARGINTYLDSYTPSTGAGTIEPDAGVTVTWTDAVLAYFGNGIDHIDRVKEAINRAHQNRVWRWEMRPLTYVPDGDLQGTTVTDYWTAAANGTAAYSAAQVFPAGSAADAVGQVGLNRVVQLTTSGGSSSITGNGIRAQLSTQQKAWYFRTSIRLVSGTGTVTFSIRDNTNSADITLQVTRGNDSNTLTTTTLGEFMVCEGTFQQPATCAEVAPRLSCSATGMVAQMGPVIMFPREAMRFPLPNRVISQDDIGNFYLANTYSGPGGIGDTEFTPLTMGGATHRFDDYGDHLTVSFNFRPPRPVWYEEAVYGAALSALTDTTTFDPQLVIKWAKYELYKYLYDRDPEKWKLKAFESQRQAERYRGAPAKTIVGRVA